MIASTILINTHSDVRKVLPLLDAFEAAKTPVQYFAVDLSEEALKRAMSFLADRYTYVKYFGLWVRSSMRWNGHAPYTVHSAFFP